MQWRRAMVNDMGVNSREVNSRGADSGTVGAGSGLAQGQVVVIGGRPGAEDRQGETAVKSRAAGLRRGRVRRRSRWMIFRRS